MGMNEEQYQELLKKAHQIMRDDAERERTMMGSALQSGGIGFSSGASLRAVAYERTSAIFDF
jgi:hypothetical protein